MPLGFERINERKQRPNAQINFIKPLANKSPEHQEIARDFLERIAAQCFPVMKQHYISVMALEEYPPNPEFLGRNFNAGEVIQLVLQDKAGRWLGFKFVQMVMMHELAHCKHMNHSRCFWKERNIYADQMKELWNKGYKGEGLWGRGKDLSSGRFVRDNMPDQVDIPEHLCGGTYRRARGRKRKRGATGASSSTDANPTYAERQQKRIARKFGKHGDGNALGEDDLIRGALERGRSKYGKPKVAQSKRGRELRANAALARLEQNKRAESESKAEVKSEPIDSETESEWSQDEDVSEIVDGPSIKDEKGHDLFRVCGDEGGSDDGGSDEMHDLQVMQSQGDMTTAEPGPRTDVTPSSRGSTVVPSRVALDISTGPDSDTKSENEIDIAQSTATTTTQPNSTSSKSNLTRPRPNKPTISNPTTTSTPSHATATTPLQLKCPICSLENEPSSLTCIVCAHVLKPALVSGIWRCTSEICRGSKYINAGDAGLCGVCGSSRPVVERNLTRDRREGRGGVVSGDILRWD